MEIEILVVEIKILVNGLGFGGIDGRIDGTLGPEQRQRSS
jgi:hypothetical protein